MNTKNTTQRYRKWIFHDVSNLHELLNYTRFVKGLSLWIALIGLAQHYTLSAILQDKRFSLEHKVPAEALSTTIINLDPAFLDLK